MRRAPGYFLLVRWLPVVLLAFFLAGAGCSGFQKAAPVRQSAQERPVHLPEPVKVIEPASASSRSTEAKTLAAVSEFLRRTQDYDMERSGALPAAPGRFAPSGERAPAAGRQAVSDGFDPELSELVPPEGGPPASGKNAFANTQVTLTKHKSAKPTVALPVIRSVSIQVSDASRASPAPAPTRAVNKPLNVEEPGEAMSVDRIMEYLVSRADQSDDFDHEWELRLAQLALGDEKPHGEIGKDLSPAARRILKSLIELGRAARQVARNPLLAGRESLERADDLRRVLADRADPLVSTVTLCRKVTTFGVYDEMADADFTAGHAVPAIVYCEVRNLKSELTSDGKYRTRVATRLELLTADGKSVWQQEEPDIVDLCRRRRTDFFIAQRVTFPVTLSPGEYVLKALVEDKQSGKANEAIHRFTVFPSASLVQRG